MSDKINEKTHLVSLLKAADDLNFIKLKVGFVITMETINDSYRRFDVKLVTRRYPNGSLLAWLTC